MFRALYKKTIGRFLCWRAKDHDLLPLYQCAHKGKRAYLFRCARCDWRSVGGLWLPWSKGIQLERRAAKHLKLPIKVQPNRAA